VIGKRFSSRPWDPGERLLPIFGYAPVIDNRSQDPVFIPGEDDPEHPPIVPFAAK